MDIPLQVVNDVTKADLDIDVKPGTSFLNAIRAAIIADREIGLVVNEISRVKLDADDPDDSIGWTSDLNTQIWGPGVLHVQPIT